MTAVNFKITMHNWSNEMQFDFKFMIYKKLEKTKMILCLSRLINILKIIAVNLIIIVKYFRVYI